MNSKQLLRTGGVILLTAAVTAAIGALLVRDQMSRHRRNLFSPHPLRRLAALGYLGNEPASIDTALLLRDFIAWEPRPLLKSRAKAVLERVEETLATRSLSTEAI